jgi:hypothetical protein
MARIISGKKITTSVPATIRPMGLVKKARARKPAVLCQMKAVIVPISKPFQML